MTDKLYPKLTYEQLLALEPYYSKHVAAMTDEGLFGKADIAEQLALRDMKIAMLEAEVLYPTDHLTKWLADQNLILELGVVPNQAGYTAVLIKQVPRHGEEATVASFTSAKWQDAIRGVIREVNLELPSVCEFNTILKLKDDVERLEKQIQFLRGGGEADATLASVYGGVLQSFRDLFEAREHFTSALMRQGGAGLGPLSDVVQEKAEIAFRALKAADRAFHNGGKVSSALEETQHMGAALGKALGRVLLNRGEVLPSTLDALLKEAREAVDAMSPEEREAMYQAQRASWARGQVGLIDSDREYAESRGLDGD